MYGGVRELRKLIKVEKSYQSCNRYLDTHYEEILMKPYEINERNLLNRFQLYNGYP